MLSPGNDGNTCGVELPICFSRHIGIYHFSACLLDVCAAIFAAVLSKLVGPNRSDTYKATRGSLVVDVLVPLLNQAGEDHPNARSDEYLFGEVRRTLGCMAADTEESVTPHAVRGAQ